MIVIRNLSYVLIFILLSSLIFPVFSFPAYASFSSALASPSTAQKENQEIELFDTNSSIAPPIVLPNVINTVDNRERIFVQLGYYTNKDQIKYIKTYLNKDGYFSFSKPSDFVSFAELLFGLSTSSYSVLPSPGNYTFQGAFASNTGGMVWKPIRTAVYYKNNNTREVASRKDVKGFSQFSGDWYFTTTLKVASNTDRFYLYFPAPVAEDLSFPFGGYLRLDFEAISSDSSTDLTSNPVPPPSSDQVQSNIANSVDQISSGVTVINNNITNMSASINKNLEEIIRTISMQLEAFWNQLYNYIHVPTYNLISQIKISIDNFSTQMHRDLIQIDTDILDSFDDLINHNSDYTNKIISNDNKNHDELVNGYDNSSLTNENNKLNGVLDEYNKAEDTLLKDTKSNLDTFAFDNPFTQFTVVLSDISSILDGIYNGLGMFNIPIGFSLTLTIAMLCIGWYRFKGGA